MQLKDMELFRQQAYIGGAWADADNGATIAVNNPATGEILGAVPNMGAAETRRAIDAAHAAWEGWKVITQKERGQILRRWYDLVMQHRDDLAMLMTLEQGKPLRESKGEIAYAASFIEWFAEEAKRVYGDVIPSPWPDKRFVVIKQPVGVCAAITPWNFPSAMITRKAAPALAAGCTIVIKPASQTPFSALALAELAHRAGIPHGVFSVITGNAGAIGAEMTANPLVRKITFTGSTEVGKKLIEQSGATVKKISMELGGNAPFIVFDDADLDAAVEGAMIAKYRNSGQVCVAANRILVQSGVHDEFARRLAEKVKTLKTGPGHEAGVEIGPLIDERALARVEELIEDAVGKGAQVAAGGGRHELGGTFFQPSVLCNASTDMRFANEEIFGPVAALIRFHSEAEAIRMANDTPFGLAAYFYSRDIGRIWRVGEALEYGMVGINTGILGNEMTPFGGMKESGLGREGSKYGLDEYLEIKYMAMGGI